jgi:hypothetical protein
MTTRPASDDGEPTFIKGLISPPQEPTSPGDAIAWWEQRRLPYNLVVGAVAVVCLVLYCFCITSAGVLQEGEDVVEPLALLAAPLVAILVNVCYTAGWVVDAPLRYFVPGLTPRFTTGLFILGFAFSLLVVSFPAIFWGCYCLLQLLQGPG